MEVYYYGDGELSKVTENSTSDTSVCFLDDKLYWMGNHAIMCMTGGSAATVETMVDNLPESVSTFKVLKSADGQKAIVWEDVNEKAQFYGTYYNEALDTSNSDYETNCSLASNGDDLAVVWQQNSENDPFSVEGTNSIHRKQLVGGKWQSEETIASNLPIVNSIACTYIGHNSVVAYSAKTNMGCKSAETGCAAVRSMRTGTPA